MFAFIAIVALVLTAVALKGGAAHRGAASEDETHFERFRTVILDLLTLLLSKPQITEEQRRVLTAASQQIRTMPMPALLPPVAHRPAPNVPPSGDAQLDRLGARLLPEMEYLVPRMDLAGLDAMLSSGVTRAWAEWVREIRQHRQSSLTISGIGSVTSDALGTILGRALALAQMGI